jgi:hypothetical protein
MDETKVITYHIQVGNRKPEEEKIYKPDAFLYEENIFDYKKAFKRYNEILAGDYPFNKEFKKEEITIVMEARNGKSREKIDPKKLEDLLPENLFKSKFLN